MADDDTTTADAAQEAADFGAGFADTETKTIEKPTKPEKPEAAATPRTEEPPEFVQITAKELADIRAAAAKTAGYDSQLSKVFGTIGQLQKALNEQRAAAEQAAPPAAREVKIPEDAFAAMRRDFPELAEQTEAAIKAALSHLPAGASDADEERIKRVVLAQVAAREIKALEEDYPDWRDIVGAVTAGEQPDPEHPFRKWLGTKDAAYQQRINASESAQVLARAIRTFQKEATAAATPPRPAPTPRDQARAERIRNAVQPRSDSPGGQTPRTELDEFHAGFNDRYPHRTPPPCRCKPSP